MKPNSERGAMLIMVAIALLCLTLFSAFVVDQGILYVSRRQAQTSADAGALAGAYWLIDNPTDLDGARNNARALSHQNAVWLEQPAAADVLVDVPITCPPSTGGGQCIKVDVLRGAKDAGGTQHTNYLPTIFLHLVGQQTQGINATATAQLLAANATGCMRPWFMIDHYTDVNGDGKYDAGDLYTSPGYQVPKDIGSLVDFHVNQSPSGYGQIDVGAGGDDIRDAIEHCVGGGANYHIGQTVPTKPGATNGPEKQGIQQLLDWDPFASFDVESQQVINSCASSGCTCGTGPCPNGPSESPRVAIVALCDPNQADCAAGGQSNGQITITNFLTFFLLGYDMDKGDVLIHAQLMGAAGEIDPSGGPSPSAFLQVVRLVR